MNEVLMTDTFKDLASITSAVTFALNWVMIMGYIQVNKMLYMNKLKLDMLSHVVINVFFLLNSFNAIYIMVGNGALR